MTDLSHNTFNQHGDATFNIASFFIREIKDSVLPEKGLIRFQTTLLAITSFPLKLSDLSFCVGGHICNATITEEKALDCQKQEELVLLDEIIPQDNCFCQQASLSLTLYEKDFAQWIKGDYVRVCFKDENGITSNSILRFGTSRDKRENYYYIVEKLGLVAYFRRNPRGYLTFRVTQGASRSLAQKTYTEVFNMTLSTESNKENDIEADDNQKALESYAAFNIKNPRFINSSTDQTMTIECTLVSRSDFLLSLKDISVLASAQPCKFNILTQSEVPRSIAHEVPVRIVIDMSNAASMLYQNYIRICLIDGYGNSIERNIAYAKPTFMRLKHSVTSPIYYSPDGAHTAYVHCNTRGQLVLTVTHQNPPDLTNYFQRYPDANPRSHVTASFKFPHFKNTSDALTIKSKITIQADFPLALNTLSLLIGEYKCPFNIQAGYPLDEQRYKHTCHIIANVPVDVLAELPIHSAVRIGFQDGYGNDTSRGIRYIGFLKKYLALHGPYYISEQHGLTAFFRQNAGKLTSFTVRHGNTTDSHKENAKLYFAWLISKLLWWHNPLLLYEKNAQHYEESASVVFEKLIDAQEKNVWFILSDRSPVKQFVDEKYKSHILIHGTFKHYLYFFCSRKFIGTEAMAHALELRCQNIMVQRKLKSKKNKYVFLQHGVMYMVSLDSPERSSFRRSAMKGESYIVVSSEKEAEHFIKYADFKHRDLIVCGLPKFDTSYLNPDADKILIMFTWRPWEFASVRINPAETKYVQIIKRVIDAIPSNLKDKVIVAPHPLFDAASFVGNGGNVQIESYDRLLRDVKVLITDYSSIAYDAFYRGANVLFYWEEKEECMNRYGEPTHLMINDETAFGPTVYESTEISTHISRLYASGQDPEYIERYRQIVTHHDGHNTERLIDQIRKRNVI